MKKSQEIEQKDGDGLDGDGDGLDGDQTSISCRRCTSFVILTFL